MWLLTLITRQDTMRVFPIRSKCSIELFMGISSRGNQGLAFMPQQTMAIMKSSFVNRLSPVRNGGNGFLYGDVTEVN